MRTPISRLFFALALVTVGQGLLHALVASRSDNAGLSPTLIGLLTTSFFGGYAAGLLLGARLIGRLRHARAFSLAVTLVGLSAVLFPHVGLAMYFVLRFFDGLGYAVMLLAVESWISLEAAPGERGRRMAQYMVVFYVALGAGPLLLGLFSSGRAEPFALVAALALAAALVGWRIEPPVVAIRGEERRVSLLTRAPLALIGSAASGLIFGALYALGPVYGRGLQLSEAGAGAWVAAVIAGGALLQLPFGRWSDRVGRVSALLVAALGTVAVSGVLAFSVQEVRLSFVGGALFGGLAATLYPLAANHLSDHLAASERIAGSRLMVAACASGSLLGAPVAGAMMERFGPPGLFVYAGTVGLGTAAACLAALPMGAGAGGMRRARGFRRG